MNVSASLGSATPKAKPDGIPRQCGRGQGVQAFQPGKPADAAYAAGPPAVFVIDDGGSQVKPFLLPAGMQGTVAVFSPGKARRRAFQVKGNPPPQAGQRMACAEPLTAECSVMLQLLLIHGFLRCEKKPGKPPRKGTSPPVGWWNTGSSIPYG